MPAEPVSPELVLVLPADERREALESLPVVLDSIDSPRSRTGARLSRWRFASAVAVYTLSRAVEAIPFLVTVLAGAFLVTLVLSLLG